MMCCYCCSQFNIENWTRYGDAETYIDIEVDDIYLSWIQVFKFKPRNTLGRNIY